MIGCWVLCGLLGQFGASLPLDAMSVQSLANPVLHSAEEIDAHIALCRQLLVATPAEEASRRMKMERQMKQSLARLFLVFADPDRRRAGEEQGVLQLIDLATYEDPALGRLRDRVGLPAPRGHVFVRTYSSRHVMPNEILAAFHREDTRGVTFFGRYIAMLAPDHGDAGEQRLYERVTRRVLSHELVHAFIGSTLDWQTRVSGPGQDLHLANRLPVWFHEGCATYLSGSPGGECVSGWVETPVGYRQISVRSRAPADYRAYKLAFDYAESRLGRRRMYDTLKRIIQSNDVEIILRRLKVSSFDEMHQQAQGWQARRWGLIYALAIGLLLAVGFYVWHLLPSSAEQTGASESDEL
jgi:hypothetical protein